VSAKLEPYAGEQLLTTAPGVSLAAVVLGPPEADTVVLLVNGAGANLLMWSPLIGELARRFRVVCFDLRGTGRSRADCAPLTLMHYADDARCLLDRMDVPKAVVWGAGLGSRVGLHLALAHPQRVAALAAYDAAIGPPPSRSERSEGVRQARADREAAGLHEATVSSRWFIHLDPRRAQEAAHVARTDPLDAGRLCAMTVPTLVVSGRHDPNLPRAKLLASTLPNASFAVMECAGHGTVVERPQRALELFLGFLDALA
jgi:pimeloyl-ACP methyl ester carboxylesterase